ncbi:MAG: divalent-cation tolerance protein CutA [Rickettsiales bacterium]|jgi:periplasmic divalent cation tolerance protein
MKILYSVFASKEEAVSVARALLAENLIACANVLDGSASIYRWQGEIQQSNEAIFFAKTTGEQAEKAVSRIKNLHSYDLPCILILPVESGFLPFIDWVENEVG